MEQSHRGFIDYVRQHFNNDVCLTIKKYMTVNRKLASYTSRKMFLTRCRRYGVYPNHIINHVNCLFTNIEPNMPFNNKIQCLLENFKRKILNVEIEVTFWKIKDFNRIISAYKYELNHFNLDGRFLQEFYATQDQLFCNLLNSFLNIVNRKFYAIRNQQHHTVDIAHHNACRNISDVDVPNEVLNIVSLGPKFNLPFFNKEDVPAFKILAQTESIIREINNEHQQNVARFQICNVFQNFLSRNCVLTMKEKYLKNLTIETKNFMRHNQNIIILNADKGNISVIMLRSEYEDKIKNLVSDHNTYITLNRDPTLSLQNLNNNKIINLFLGNYINNETKTKLTTYSSVVPKFYGLPKIHKPDHPLRPIVCFINSPTYKTSKYLAEILKVSIDDRRYNCRNSYELVDFVKQQNIPNRYVLISLDVVSLFTNIKIDLALETISNRWSMIEPHTRIPKIKFLDILEFCLKSGYFSLFNIYFKQINGVAMGSPLSPIVADIVMEVLLDTVLNSIDFNILFIKKYVDDLLLCIPDDKINCVLSKFNNNRFGLEFTLEIESDNKLPFLDTILFRKNNGQIDTIWYAKNLSSGRILNFNSFHPLSQRINTAFGFVYRVKKLTTDITVDTNQIIKDYLINNKYPKYLINKLINQYNQTNSGQIVNTVGTNTNVHQNFMYKSIYYIKNLSDQISSILRKFNTNCKITFSAANSIRNIFSQIKDITPKLNRSNVVYLIPCNHCHLKYIGTTKQLLKNRISQHKSDVKPPIRNAQATTLCQHSSDTGHTFKFDHVKILDSEKIYKNRLFLEMAHIIGNHEVLVNKKSDTDDLNQIYSGIIDFISKFPKYKSFVDT